ncbi:TPA: hypothetical protein QDZ75_003217 [Stenotrophomonas maltophilia]|jgi:hypothetical protein|nr:hypothetical protein [Stenotrophomonas maltophilia]HEL5401576.1 hypothetical protein [Stenotrophomonas maltophilia]
MPVAVPFRSRVAGWRTLLVLALASASLPAAAQSMACGTYKDVDGGATLTIESEAHGFLSSPYQATERLRLVRQDNLLGTGNLSTGRLENWEFSDDDRTISGGYHTFQRQAAAACKPVPDMVEGSCMADTSDCLEALPDAAPAQLHAWCSEGVEVACTQLQDTYQRQAKEAHPQPAKAEPRMPAFCRDDASPDEAEACLAVMKVMASELMGMSVLGLQRSPDAPLPAPQLDELAALCARQQGEAFCSNVAEALWNGGRLQQAAEALQRSCAQRPGAAACDAAKALAIVSRQPASALAAVAATTLPCGRFEAGRGLLSNLHFLDGGLVEVAGLGSRLRARVQDGRILLRRDVGSDFVLQPLANGNLVGIDHDNRFGYYERMDKAASQCQPPAAFVEIPQPLDCPTVARKGGAAACCDDGKLLGCKVAGEELHRADKWQQAQPYFIKLCSAGVRDGCLGLAAGYVHTGDPKVPQTMAAICAKDGKGTHVACDVDATRNWPALKAEAEAAP